MGITCGCCRGSMLHALAEAAQIEMSLGVFECAATRKLEAQQSMNGTSAVMASQIVRQQVPVTVVA